MDITGRGAVSYPSVTPHVELNFFDQSPRLLTQAKDASTRDLRVKRVVKEIKIALLGLYYGRKSKLNADLVPFRQGISPRGSAYREVKSRRTMHQPEPEPEPVPVPLSNSLKLVLYTKDTEISYTGIAKTGGFMTEDWRVRSV